jgi:hypothetical protein
LRRANVTNLLSQALLFALSFYGIVGNLVFSPFLFTIALNVTVGVSGFEGREVFFEVLIWVYNN